jgi:cytochrome oxidase assembly protein ShyY1
LVSVLLLIVLPGSYLLGRWQLDRYDARREHNAQARANLSAPAADLASVVPVGGPVRDADVWRTVTAPGRYDVAHQQLVRNRPYHGKPGFHVLTPLVAADGTAVLVNRGWVEAGPSAATAPQVPPPPADQVMVTGRLRASASDRGRRGHGGLPAGQVARIDVPAIAVTLPYPLRGGYVEAVSEKPAAAGAPERIEPPELGVGPHLAYGIQWWIFGVIAVIGVVLLFRRELDDAKGDQPEEAVNDGRAPASSPR